MRIALICIEELDGRPPVIQLTETLLRLGHEVLLITRHLEKLPAYIAQSPSFDGIDLGEKQKGFGRYLSVRRDRRMIRQVIEDDAGAIDLIWTATDVSLRDAGPAIGRHPFIAQLPELIEFVPKARIGRYYLKDPQTVERCRRAAAVVVPEYNRAHIQKLWWRLPETPVVLPNRSNPPLELDVESEGYCEAETALRAESRKILLYQGIFASDRDFEPFARAVDILGDEWALYLMGRFDSREEERRIGELCQAHPNVHYIGFINPPNHLGLTKYGTIGLLPYSPASDRTRMSDLNALFCAPNKTWEYARAGLPMIGSDVPGLATSIEASGIGKVVNTDDPKAIARAVTEIDSQLDSMASASRSYYESMDFDRIVAEILKGVRK